MGRGGNLAERRISAEFLAYNSLLQNFILTYQITRGFSYLDTKLSLNHKMRLILTICELAF
jgi:hypothetical protein